MTFSECKEFLSENFPEFLKYLQEEYNEDYFNSYLGDFALFLLDSIEKNKGYSKAYIIIFNNNIV